MGLERRDGALRGWQLRVARGRLSRGSRLLLLVLAVAVLASTAVTSVGLLITATEASAVRTSLRQISPAQSQMTVNVEQTNVSIAGTEQRVDGAVKAVIGSAGSVTRTVRAYSQPHPLKVHGALEATYYAQLQDVSKHITLAQGTLPTATPSAGATQAQVAIPQDAAKLLHLAVGDKLSDSIEGHPVIVTIVGLYRIRGASSTYWAQDELRAAGVQQGFGIATGYTQINATAFGPLLVAPGTMDALGIRADRIELDYAPHFSTTDVSQITSLIDRLSTADSDVPASIGGTAIQVTYQGDSSVPLQQIAAALVVTRSTVVVVTLLLLVLSIAALAQAARLFTDTRSGDRELMRARGASRGQLLGVAALEAGLVGVLTAVISAPLARGVYAIVAAQPAMRAAGVPRDSGLPLTAWETSIALGAVFVAVLLLSLLGRSASFVSAEQTRSRQRRVTGLLRSGLDLGVVALAIVAFWQLSIYRSPVGADTTLTVDPVLVAAPALVLLAGTLIAARIFPLLARLLDASGSRSSGVLYRLASWEVGRRSQRATAVVLLLTLAIAVATFSQTFLTTWQQSQVDQADYAVGPAVRVAAIPAEGGGQRTQLQNGAVGTPQPVTRRVVDVSNNGAGGIDVSAVVLGLTSGARRMLDHGQLAVDGGAAITATLKTTAGRVSGITLPGDPTGIGAVVQFGTPGQPIPGVGASLAAIVQDGAGQLSTVNLGNFPVDGAPHQLAAKLPALPGGAKRVLPLQVVGIQATAFLGSQAAYVANPPAVANLLVGKISALTFKPDGSYTAKPTTGAATSGWSSNSPDPNNAPAQRLFVKGWQVGLAASIPGDVGQNPAAYAETAWPSEQRIPVVVSQALARALQLNVGTVIELNFSDSFATVEVAKITPLMPGTVDGSLLTANAAAGAASAGSNAIVVDQASLERALLQSGAAGSLLDEWWVNVPPSHAAAYVRAHPAQAGGDPTRSAALLALQMQQGPLRVATQAALWLAIVAAALLAAIGFAVHSASTLTARRIELAQLRAIGLSRRRLVGLIGIESAVQGALGVVFGIAVGTTLGLMAAPLIALSPNGTPAVPGVRVLIPWLQVGMLVVVVALVVVAVVAAVARTQRRSNPAGILREADNG